MFILSCSAALAFGLFPFAAGQSVASGDRGKMETAPRPGLECLQVTLLIRQMVLDRYDSTGTGICPNRTRPGWWRMPALRGGRPEKPS